MCNNAPDSHATLTTLQTAKMSSVHEYMPARTQYHNTSISLYTYNITNDIEDDGLTTIVGREMTGLVFDVILEHDVEVHRSLPEGRVVAIY